MQFLKAHYEKIILSLVLLGLAAAAALMPIKVAQEREKEEARKDQIRNPKVKELQPIDLSSNVLMLARLGHPARVTLSGDHNLFNPVRWQKGPDGSIHKAADAGPNALEVEEISPLKLELKFDDVIPPPGPQDKIRYRVSVLNETHRSSGRATPRDAGVGEKNNMFTIEEAVGPDPLNPQALRILLPGDKAPVSLTKEKPYERVLGYSADIRHPLEKKEWKNSRVNDELSFGGETYKIVAITPNEVVLSAKSNKKQTILEYKAPQK